ncbi:hypothetical protein P389DRAFT_131726, partial [Cystobasidium minutum MCA 4210]|uniref:uncharacterized protein n=1 Tax=Cystobasidium minutum MCA 4210 TaxID=1397322 RepID=UPI0034CF7168
HRPFDLRITLAEGKMPPFHKLRSLSRKEKKTLAEHIEKQHAAGFIRPSSSPAAAPVMFVPKKDGSL